MLYPELFATLEKVRWDMATDIPWQDFDSARLSEEQARTVKMNAITEWSALPATEMFLRDNQDDSDFCAFMSIWFYEEQKHALVLMEYLRRFRPALVPTEDELHAVRFPFDPAPALETLMLHFCGEIRLTQWYRRAADWHTEPVIKRIYETLSGDEARHAGAYYKYMKRAIAKAGAEAKIAFARIGVLMASAARTARPLHPTNLHVNKSLFRSTRCSRSSPIRNGWSAGSIPRSASTRSGKARSCRPCSPSSPRSSSARSTTRPNSTATARSSSRGGEARPASC